MMGGWLKQDCRRSRRAYNTYGIFLLLFSVVYSGPGHIGAFPFV